MTIESAATFLVCVILLSCGIIVLVGLVLLVNNLLHRYPILGSNPSSPTIYKHILPL